ncbi:hypothetical protein [Streptomyces sp. NPDC086023]|uniref:hypothetical protein n=1 Tax=Streptomyces sp. NPDC086023 TaxID=3365746 RepID=UPI0037D8A135
MPQEPAHPVGPSLELLVHGVGGAAPEGLLADPRTVRITGDATAAVFRRTEDADAEEHPERHAGRPVTEAYVWSRLTSGNGARALWLLLVPFMVVNLAHWARPGAPGGGRTVRTYGVLVRLVALTLTVLLVAAACEVALDLLAWQCAGTPACAAERSWLGPLAPEGHGWWSQPGRRVALCALVPAALTGLLWYLSNRTWSAYESQRPPDHEPGRQPGHDPRREQDPEPGRQPGHDPRREQDPEPGRQPGHDPGREPSPGRITPAAAEPGAGPALGRPGFWFGRRLVARLRAAHTAAGLLTVAAAVTGAAARHDRARGHVPTAVAGTVLEAFIALGALFVVGVVCRRGRAEGHADERLDRAVISLLPGCALALLVLGLCYAAWSRPGWRSHGRLPGDLTFGLLMLAQGLLVLALACVAHRLHRRHPVPGSALRGLGGPAVAMLACALGGVMSGGVAQRVADWLDGGATPGTPGTPLAGPPVLLSWQAAVLPPLLLVLLLLAGWFGARGALLRRRLAATVAAEYPGERPDTDRSRAIAGARAAASLTDTTPWFIAAVSGVTLVLGAAALAGAWLSRDVPGEAARGAYPPLAAAVEGAQALGSWLIGFGFLLFVTWGRRAYRDASARRTIGILWDVGTFWPRAAHPFAPPCYAERAVPDLVWRMTAWTDRTREAGGRLVVSGHSQGSVLAAAAVWQLPPAVRDRVALLTYGSPLRRLYGRWFPAHFGPGPLTDLHGAIGRWRNLWRATDPIGGPVRYDGSGPEHVDRGPLKDPLAYGRTPEHPLPAPLLGHSDYPADPAFAAERDALLARIGPVRPAPAEGTAAVPVGGPAALVVTVSTALPGTLPAAREPLVEIPGGEPPPRESPITEPPDTYGPAAANPVRESPADPPGRAG